MHKDYEGGDNGLDGILAWFALCELSIARLGKGTWQMITYHIGLIAFNVSTILREGHTGDVFTRTAM